MQELNSIILYINFQNKYSLPLAILWQFICNRYGYDALHPSFPSNFQMPQIQDNQGGPETGWLEDESPYYKRCTKDEYSTKIPEITTKSISNTSIGHSIYHKSFDSYKKSESSLEESKEIHKPTPTPSTIGGVWEKDEISPACHLFSYEKSNPQLVWTKEATFRRIDSTRIEVFIHSDKSVLFVRDRGRYFSHYRGNDLNNGLLRTFTHDSIPLTVTSEGGKYSMRNLVEQWYKIYENSTQEDGTSQENTEDADPRNWLLEAISASPKDIIDSQNVEGWGKFTAYKNGSIQIKFEDRTHLRMKRGNPYVKIITYLGTELKFFLDRPREFNKFVTTEEKESLDKYLQTGYEYMEWASMTPEQRFAKEKEEMIQQHRLKSALEDFEYLHTKNSF